MNTAKYKMSKKAFAINFLYAMGIVILLGKIFYGEWWYGVGLIPIGIYFFKLRKQDLIKKRKRKLTKEFKDMLVCISDLINTGYSIENAIKEAYKDLIQIYEEDADICKEVRIMISQLRVNMPVENVIKELANRTQLEEAYTFSEVFSVAKRRGGSMEEIIKNITDTILLKESVKEDIEVAITEKKMEQKIMSVIPLAMVGYISFTSPGFLDVMYETWIGRGVMTISLLLYMVAYLWSKRISDIEV